MSSLRASILEIGSRSQGRATRAAIDSAILINQGTVAAPVMRFLTGSIAVVGWEVGYGVLVTPYIVTSKQVHEDREARVCRKLLLGPIQVPRIPKRSWALRVLRILA